MRASCIALSPLAFTAATASGAPPQSTAAATSAGPSLIRPAPEVAPSGEHGAEIRFRTDLGLRADVPYVEGLANAAGVVASEYGYLLTESESRFLERREAARDELGPIRETLEGRAPGFAGMYLDNAAAYAHDVALSLVVMFTVDAEQYRPAITALMPAHSELRLVEVQHSYADLLDVLARVNEDRDWHQRLGIEVRLAGVDEPRNRVLLGISRPDEGAAAALASRYGPSMVYIYVAGEPELDACTRANCPTPWPAGLKISTNGGWSCTSGYSYQASSGNWYMGTAGHCPGDRWYHNGTFMGATPAGKNRFVSGSYADIQAFDIVNANHSNVVLTGTAGCNPCMFRTMTARQSVGGDIVGDTTCSSGYATGSNCGVLKIRLTDFLYKGKLLHNQRVADYTRHGGDSGAPIFRGTLALGSHVHFQPDPTEWAVYSHIYWSETELGMHMCFTGC